MDHPIVSEAGKSLRQRVIHLLSGGYSISRHSNIVFVCGGNDEAHMRTLFCEYCSDNLKDFEVFLPEAAMDDALSDENSVPFNIADFEELVGNLAHAIVVFPEAPGSFAETGYFSAVNNLSEKCILVLDANRQRIDSFISLGPAAKISTTSRFHPNIQLDYKNPDFSVVSERIRRINKKTYRQAFEFDAFSDLNEYALACLLYQIVDLMRVCTYDEIGKILVTLFKNRYSKDKTHKLLSILLGASILRRIGDYGHFIVNPTKEPLLSVKDGHKNAENEVRLEIAESLFGATPELLNVVEAANDAR